MIPLQPVILSGGSGTRLWPLSRAQFPKQLLSLTGSATMLQATALRAQIKGNDIAVRAPIVVCNEEYRFVTAEQLRVIDKPAAALVLEPFGRNTAPALTLAALMATREEEDPVLLVEPADHVISDIEAFQAAVRAGIPHADHGALVTFGITPDRPETGYGYVQRGTLIDGGHMIARFVEKPDASTAMRYIASGDYLWNSGLFMMRASVWLRAIRHFHPTIAQACQVAFERGTCDNDFFRIDRSAFEACPSDSIDYAVMEKLAQAPELGIDGRMIAMSAGWSDVGAWDALWQIAEKDDNGNVARGDVLLEQATDNLVFAQGRLVACVGIDRMIVVETPDAVLVADKDNIQDVRHIVSRLQEQQRCEALTHRKIHRPWGWYDSIDSGERFQVKRIVVNPGAALSLQMHHHRAEHWIIVRGTARITCGEEVFLLSENQSTYIPLGVKHRLENPGKFPLEMIEVQSGSYLGEDDIVRFDDTYGRR